MPFKVSVIMPIYNVEPYLRECLDSVLSQDLNDIEIICINDGSSDGCKDILESYAKKHSAISVVHKQNEGVAKARNEALAMALGEFVCFIDPDDFYPNKHTLSLLYNAAKEHNALICGGSFSYYANGEIITDFKEESLQGYIFKTNGFMQYKDYQFDFGFHRFIYKRIFLLENHIFYPLYTRYEDPVFFVKAMIKAGQFYALSEVTYRYRIGYQSITSWSDSAWNDQNKGFEDVLLLSKKYKLWGLYHLTYYRANEAAKALGAMICAGRANVASLFALGVILEKYHQAGEENTIALQCQIITDRIKNLHTMLAPLAYLKFISTHYKSVFKTYFRIRLFKPYSVIRLFGVTLYENAGGGKNVVFYAYSPAITLNNHLSIVLDVGSAVDNNTGVA